MIKKINGVLQKIFAIGLIIALFAGGISLVGYIAALCIGGDIATQICAFIFKEYFPWVIRFTSVIIGIGLVSMYLGREKALTMSSEDNKDKKNKEKNKKKDNAKTEAAPKSEA